jgi:Lrp/AsnC family transcriptional regulator for asnA, asnC and gidA
VTTGRRPDGHGAARPVDLDDVDRRLLRILQADGRASYATMAPEVGLSAPAVRLRVQRLVDVGILQVVG